MRLSTRCSQKRDRRVRSRARSRSKERMAARIVARLATRCSTPSSPMWLCIVPVLLLTDPLASIHMYVSNGVTSGWYKRRLGKRGGEGIVSSTTDAWAWEQKREQKGVTASWVKSSGAWKRRASNHVSVKRHKFPEPHLRPDRVEITGFPFSASWRVRAVSSTCT